LVPLERLKDDLYRALGYDLETENPTKVILKESGLRIAPQP